MRCRTGAHYGCNVRARSTGSGARRRGRRRLAFDRSLASGSVLLALRRAATHDAARTGASPAGRSNPLEFATAQSRTDAP
ncbi:MAG: hypothetical protein ACK52I_30750 [Pseudomonadota bacterium]